MLNKNLSIRMIWLFAFLLQFCCFAQTTFDMNDHQAIIDHLIKRREAIRNNRAIVCSDQSEFPGRYSHSKKECKQGDIILFAGINCLAAHLAGDEQTAKDRCRDVFNSQITSSIHDHQSLDGKWVRGEVSLATSSHFSRDMGLGVMAAAVGEVFYNLDNPNPQKQKNQLNQWLNYVSRPPQKGKFMCHEKTFMGFGNRCNIYQGVGFGAQLYRVLHNSGVVDYRGKKRKHQYKKSEFNNSNNQFEFAPKLKAKLLNTIRKKYHRYQPKVSGRELALQFHDGYQIHLKTVELFTHLAMDRMELVPNIFHQDDFLTLNYKEYNRIAKKVFRKSSINPWHRLIYKGLDTDLLYSVFNQFCPVKLAPKPRHLLVHYEESGYAWQSQENSIQWEVGDGHDCIFLLNSIIANLKGKIEFGQLFNPKSCPKNQQEIGQYQTQKNEWSVCLDKSMKNSMTKCHSKAGVIRYKLPSTNNFSTAEAIITNNHGTKDFSLIKNEQAYCLEKKQGYFRATKINKVCGSRRKLIGFYNTKEQRSLWNTDLAISSIYTPHLYPICSPFFRKKIRLSRCFKENRILPIIELQKDSNQETKENTHCLINKGSFFVKKEISHYCPLGTKYTGHKKIGWQWPICSPWMAKKISVENCLKKSPTYHHQSGYCLWPKNGYFKGRPLKKKNILDQDDELTNSLNQRNKFQTIPQQWTIQNNFIFNDFLSHSDPGDLIDIRMQGTLSWRTISDRKDDYFFVKVFRVDEDQEIELTNPRNNSPGLFENVPVVFNRTKDGFIQFDGETWDGNYTLDYNLSLLHHTPHIDLIFKVYLNQVEDNGSNYTSLAYEHRQNIISRSNQILEQRKILRVSPNPFTSLNELKVDILSNPIIDSDYKTNTLYHFVFVLHDMLGREVARSTGPQLKNTGQQISLIFPQSQNAHNLSPGIYILNIYLNTGKSLLGLYGSHQLIKM